MTASSILRAHPWLTGFMAEQRLPTAFAGQVERIWAPLAGEIATVARGRGPGFVMGLCGAQGSGKSTAGAVIAKLLEERGLSVALLSLDDLYLTLAERRALARTVHPLLLTRGPPGTHDVALGESVLGALSRAEAVALPRFDKALDDRASRRTWPVVRGPVDVVLFEGWCVGATPQDAGELAAPINDLERLEDPHGLWRGFVNTALAGPYQRLFSRIDWLCLLAAPDFEAVAAWRQEQEAKLADRLAALQAAALASSGATGQAMSPAEVSRFIAHFERLTRHILREMPGRADRILRLDRERRMVGQG